MAQRGGTWSPREEAKRKQYRPQQDALSTSDALHRGKQVRQGATAPNNEKAQDENDGWDLVEAPPKTEIIPAEDSDEVVGSTSMELKLGWGSRKFTVFSYKSTWSRSTDCTDCPCPDCTDNRAGGELTDDKKEDHE